MKISKLRYSYIGAVDTAKDWSAPLKRTEVEYDFGRKEGEQGDVDQQAHGSGMIVVFR